MNQKFEITDKTKTIGNIVFHQIKAIKSFGNVKAGDIGGWLEKEENLSNINDAWVYDDAQVSGDVQVFGNAQVSGDARVYDDAQVSGDAWVYDDAQVYDNARVSGNVRVSGNAQVYGNAQVSGDTQVSGNARVGGNALVYGDVLVKTPVINLISSAQFNVTAFCNSVVIGCKIHTVKKWEEIFKQGTYKKLCSDDLAYEQCRLAFEFCKKTLIYNQRNGDTNEIS